MKKIYWVLVMVWILFSGCKKDSDNHSSTPAPTPEPTYSYFKGTLNSIPFTFTEDGNTIQGFQCCYSSGTGTGTAQICTCAGIDNPSSKLFSVHISKIIPEIFFDNNPDSCFKSLLKTGPNVFAISTNTANGVIVNYEDHVNNISYNSYSGAQTSASFQITSASFSDISVTSQSTHIVAWAKGTFSCKVYDSNGVAPPVTLTNVEFYLYFDSVP